MAWYTYRKVLKFAALFVLTAPIVIGYVISQEKSDYPQEIVYQETIGASQALPWWGSLQQDSYYCFVDNAPISDLLREATARGHKVIGKTHDYLCPVGTIVVRRNGSQYPVSAKTFLNGSLTLYLDGQFQKSIDVAKVALAIQPAYSEAYNNICAAHNSLKQWKKAIEACTKAIELKPDFQLARNNLAWARKAMAESK